MRIIERRFVPATELRVAYETGAPRIQGYSALFNVLSDDLGGFRELIKPGAFTNALAKSDIRSLFNHDPNYVLGRVSASTLNVAEDDRGLVMDDTPPDTQWARDLLVSIERGDITQQSFSFRVQVDDWAIADDGTLVRSLIEIDELFDVGPVTFPAYPDTTVATRSLEQWRATHPGSVPEPKVAVMRNLAERRLKLALAQ